MKKQSIPLLLILFQIALIIGSCDSRHAAEKPGTPDTTRPTVISMAPLNGTANVVVNTAVTIAFSKAMNPATINGTTFVLTSTTTGTVAGAVTYDTASHVATFTSITVLDHNVRHTATIASNVSDEAGNTLGSSYSWSFTTIPAPGVLDSSFGSNGKVRIPVSTGNNMANALSIQQDDNSEKILTAGWSSLSSSPASTQYFTITRFLTNGAPDLTFGRYQTGKADDFIGVATSLALQSDGKIVAAGSDVVSLLSFTADFLIARYNKDGTPDTSLNSNGTMTMSTGGYVRTVANSLALQSDNSIVVAGDGTNDASTYVSIVARFTTTGALDMSFNATGVITDMTHTTSRAVAVKVQPDGMIVVGGNYQDGIGPQSFYLSRFKADGTPDDLFNSGTITASPGTNPLLADIEILSGGKILVAGTTTNAVTNADVFLMRFNADGTLDATFGTNGIVFIDDGYNGMETAAGLSVQQDGKIVVAATFNPITGSTQTKDFALFRYNADGTADTAFGNVYSMVHTDFGFNYDDIASGVQIQQDGKIVVAGSVCNTYPCNGYSYYLGLARFWP